MHSVYLGEVCEFVYGDSLKEERRRPGKVPVFGSNGIVGWHDQAITSGPTIVIGRKGSIGEINWSREPCYPIDTTYFVEKTKRPCNLRWLYFTLQKLDLTRLNKSAAVPGLNREDAYEQRIPWLVLSEQQRIAEQLEQADRLRRTRRYALELSGTFLPAAFLEFFGDLQSGSGKNTALGEIADILTGYPFTSDEYTDAGETIRLCRGANVLPDRIDWSDLALWPKSKSHSLSKYKLQVGDVVIAMDRPWISEGFKIAQIRPEHCPALLVQRVARLRGESGVPNAFLYHLLRQPAFTRHCRPTETTIPHISPTDIETFSFHVPSPARQQQFASLVERHEHLRTTQREALRQAEHLFQTLLHRAFSEGT